MGLAIDGVLAVAAVALLVIEGGWRRGWPWALAWVSIAGLVVVVAGPLMR